MNNLIRSLERVKASAGNNWTSTEEEVLLDLRELHSMIVDDGLDVDPELVSSIIQKAQQIINNFPPEVVGQGAVRRRKRTANLVEVDMARAVNSQMARSSRDRSQPLPRRLLNADVQAVEPRQIRNILAQDMKDTRWRTIESAPNETLGKRMFNSQYRRERHTACGKATGDRALRFLTPGSRDPQSNELPRCYFDPKGRKVRNGRGIVKSFI